MFKTNETNILVNEAVKDANDVALRSYVIGRISGDNRYDMCNCDNFKLAIDFRNQFESRNVYVKIYYPKWRYSKAIGYFNASIPDEINVNGYKLNSMKKWQLVSNFYHEFAHSIMEFSSCDCHHGSNSSVGKENTFQYSINRYVKDFYRVEDTIVYRKSWFRRILDKLKWW